MRKHLEKLRKIERKRYHPLIHKIHKKHKISKKTLFYVKEYGPRTNVPRTIIKESIKVLIFASIISSLGGLAVENIKTIFVSIIPLIVLLPAFNDMLGDYGSIISSKFSTMLHEGKVRGHWSKNQGLRKLLIQVMIIALITGVFSSAVALGISYFSSYAINAWIATKIFIAAVIDVIVLVSVLFFISVYAGLHFYRKKEDPNNFLIPITTSIADFGNMIILSALVILIF
jgi:cation transporter-like permease